MNICQPCIYLAGIDRSIDRSQFELLLGTGKIGICSYVVACLSSESKLIMRIY